MKTLLSSILFISFLSIAMLTSGFKTESTQYAVPVEVVYGRGWQCGGSGLCNIIEGDTIRPTSNLLVIDGLGNPLQFEIQKINLSQEDLNRHFSGDIIHLDNDFSMDGSLSRDNRRIEVPAGDYALENDEYSFRVVLSARD